MLFFEWSRWWFGIRERLTNYLKSLGSLTSLAQFLSLLPPSFLWFSHRASSWARALLCKPGRALFAVLLASTWEKTRLGKLYYLLPCDQNFWDCCCKMVMETDVFTKSLRMVVSSNLMRLRENSGFFLDVNLKHREEKSFLLYDF